MPLGAHGAFFRACSPPQPGRSQITSTAGACSCSPDLAAAEPACSAAGAAHGQHYAEDGAHPLLQAVLGVGCGLVAAHGPGAALHGVAQVLPRLAQGLVQGCVQGLLVPRCSLQDALWSGGHGIGRMHAGHLVGCFRRGAGQPAGHPRPWAQPARCKALSGVATCNPGSLQPARSRLPGCMQGSAQGHRWLGVLASMRQSSSHPTACMRLPAQACCA